MANALVLKSDLGAVPDIIERSGGNARFAYDEFFKATINNEHTRRAYTRIVGRLLAWCETNKLELRQITPGIAGDYIGQLEGSATTKNQALAALPAFLRCDGDAPRRATQFFRISARHQVQRHRRQDGRDFNRPSAETFSLDRY